VEPSGREGKEWKRREEGGERESFHFLNVTSFYVMKPPKISSFGSQALGEGTRGLEMRILSVCPYVRLSHA